MNPDQWNWKKISCLLLILLVLTMALAPFALLHGVFDG